jgi:hypothetical protein
VAELALDHRPAPGAEDPVEAGGALGGELDLDRLRWLLGIGARREANQVWAVEAVAGQLGGEAALASGALVSEDLPLGEEDLSRCLECGGDPPDDGGVGDLADGVSRRGQFAASADSKPGARGENERAAGADCCELGDEAGVAEAPLAGEGLGPRGAGPDGERVSGDGAEACDELENLDIAAADLCRSCRQLFVSNCIDGSQVRSGPPPRSSGFWFPQSWADPPAAASLPTTGSGLTLVV